jgi:ribonuclease M5
MKPVIKETIVVEGTHDSAHLKRFFDCDTIVTGGLALFGKDGRKTEEIRAAAERNGIIVFTDPDGPGEKIRRRVEEIVPDCRHAFVMKENARTKHKVGVEHASFEVLQEALAHTVTWGEPKEETISPEVFYELGLAGKENSEALRERAARAFHIGYANAKTMRGRLNRLGVTEEELRKAVNGETDCECRTDT